MDLCWIWPIHLGHLEGKLPASEFLNVKFLSRNIFFLKLRINLLWVPFWTLKPWIGSFQKRLILVRCPRSLCRACFPALAFNKDFCRQLHLLLLRPDVARGFSVVHWNQSRPKRKQPVENPYPKQKPNPWDEVILSSDFWDIAKIRYCQVLVFCSPRMSWNPSWCSRCVEVVVPWCHRGLPHWSVARARPRVFSSFKMGGLLQWTSEAWNGAWNGLSS